MTALSVPWPLPVQASDPKRTTFVRSTRESEPACLRPATNSAAAFIGPTVCEDEGPMPTLNSSKTPIMACQLCQDFIRRQFPACIIQKAPRIGREGTPDVDVEGVAFGSGQDYGRFAE